MRNVLIFLHRWLSLMTSLLVILLGVTGGALVFEGALDRAFNPGLWHVAASGPLLSNDTILARAGAAVPNRAIGVLSFARAPDRAYMAQAGSTQVFVDQFTGRVLGTRDRRDLEKSLPRILHRLHVNMMFGEIGGEIVAVTTGVCIVLLISGIYLWWLDKQWRIRWSASWKRIAYDLHHSLGIIATLVILIMLSSGEILHYRALGKWIASIDNTPPAKQPVQAAASDNAAVTISVDSVVQTAVRALPEAVITAVVLPSRTDQPFSVSLRFPEDRSPGGRSRVLIDRYRGTVLLAARTRLAPTGASINNVMRSVHTGDVFGKPGEAIWMIASLVLASQAVSGFLMWWNGLAGRAALARQARARAARAKASGV